MYGSLEVNMREIESPNYTFAIMCSRRFNDIGLLAIADKYGDEFKPPIGYFLELNGEYLKNEKRSLHPNDLKHKQIVAFDNEGGTHKYILDVKQFPNEYEICIYLENTPGYETLEKELSANTTVHKEAIEQAIKKEVPYFATKNIQMQCMDCGYIGNIPEGKPCPRCGWERRKF